MIGALFLLDTDRNITTTCLQTLEMNIMNGIYIFTMASARKEEESGLSFYILYFYCCFGSFVPTFIILSFKLVQPLETSFPHHLNRAKFNKSLTPSVGKPGPVRYTRIPNKWPTLHTTKYSSTPTHSSNPHPSK